MSGELTYYKKLTDIIEVRYTDETKFVLFKCNWVDNRTGVKVDNFGITSINFSHLLYKDNNPIDEPFILALQSEQVMYVEDPIEPEWEIVIKMTSRDTFDIGKDGNSNTIVALPQAQPYSFEQLDERRSIHEGEEMWVRHGFEGTLVEKRAAQSPTIENQQQNNPVYVVESDSDKEMEDESKARSSTSNDVRKKGQGPALGYQGKEKIKIIFNECMQPIGDSSTELANLLIGIAKCGARAPLNIVSWKSMPNTNLELMWQDVQSGKPEQWPDLVNYWQRDDVQDRMKEKLNEVPESEQTDSFKEQVFIDLVGPDGHESVKTFGGGVSSRNVFGTHSLLRNTTSLDVIERMVQAQVAA
ncbi:copia protein [Tanacetum coccineum]